MVSTRILHGPVFFFMLTSSDGQYSASDHHNQQGYMPSRSSTPTFTESRDGHRGREPYVSRSFNWQIRNTDRSARLDGRCQHPLVQGGD